MQVDGIFVFTIHTPAHCFTVITQRNCDSSMGSFTRYTLLTLFAFSENHVGNGVCNLILFPLCSLPSRKNLTFSKSPISYVQKGNVITLTWVQSGVSFCDITCCMFDIYTHTHKSTYLLPISVIPHVFHNNGVRNWLIHNMATACHL